MTVVQFDLEADRGGKRNFEDLAEAVLWAQHQRDTWQSIFRPIVSANPNHPLMAAERGWNEVVEELQSDRRIGKPVAKTLGPKKELIAEDSAVFEAVLWAVQNLPDTGIQAAAIAAGLPGGRLNWAEPAQVTAVFAYERVLERITSARDKKERDQQQDTIENNRLVLSNLQTSLSLAETGLTRVAEAASKNEATLNDRLITLTTSISTAELELQAKTTALSVSLDNISAGIESNIANLTEESKIKIDNWFNAFREERKLEAPVVLWKIRAEEHKKTLFNRQVAAVVCGFVGLGVAAIIAVTTYNHASSLFSSAVLPDNGQVKGAIYGMRPSFHFELLLASAATLVYLTMYLWFMRILVRLYTTEHHLYIDARGRAALTETYLSLTKEGAATDADRAIMLGVIFRPVSDGIVKEDGPPGISPAAIIAGLASNPTKPS